MNFVCAPWLVSHNARRISAPCHSHHGTPTMPSCVSHYPRNPDLCEDRPPATRRTAPIGSGIHRARPALTSWVQVKWGLNYPGWSNQARQRVLVPLDGGSNPSPGAILRLRSSPAPWRQDAIDSRFPGVGMTAERPRKRGTGPRTRVPVPGTRSGRIAPAQRLARAMRYS